MGEEEMKLEPFMLTNVPTVPLLGLTLIEGGGTVKIAYAVLRLASITVKLWLPKAVPSGMVNETPVRILPESSVEAGALSVIGEPSKVAKSGELAEKPLPLIVTT
jgi:hypothetical protein